MSTSAKFPLISAKTFRAPLLRTLVDLSKGKAGKAFPHSEVYGPCAKAAGVTLDQFGDTSEGKNRVTRWIQEAMKSLKRKHLISSPGRGLWALTAPGVQEALKLGYGKAPKKKAPPEAASTPEVEVSQHPYHDDPYIRHLAAEAVPCFGAFSSQSQFCVGCPIQEACLDAMAAELSFCAELLDREQPQGASEPDRKPPQPAHLEGELSNARLMIATTSSGCGLCVGSIKQGVRCYWVQAGGDRMYLHEACHVKHLKLLAHTPGGST